MYLLDDVFTMLDAACRRHSCTFKLGTVGDAYVAVGVDSAVYRSLFHGAEAPPSPRTGHFHLRPKTFFLLPLLVLSFFLSRRFCLASTPLHLAVDPIRAVFIGRPRFCFRRFGLALLFFFCVVFFFTRPTFFTFSRRPLFSAFTLVITHPHVVGTRSLLNRCCCCCC